MSSAPVLEAGAKKTCALGAVEVADKVIRQDAGLTVVTLADGRVAIGYAGIKGEPRAVLLTDSAHATTLEVDSSALPPAPPKPGDRVIQRITPLGFADGGLAMSAALDVMDIKEDKSKSFRCGPADKPLSTSDGEPRVKDCRSFTDGAHTFALESLVEGDSVRWALAMEKPELAILHEAKFTAEKLATPDRYLYQVPVASFLPGGVVMASREDGGLVVARTDSSFATFGKAARFWLGAPTTMPAIAAHDHDAAIFFALQTQRDLYGMTFAIEAKEIPKPEKLALDDPSPPTDGERTSISASHFPNGDVVVAFADGKSLEKKARVTVLGKTLQSLVPVADLGQDVTEIRVIASGDGKASVAWIGKKDGAFALQTAPLSCTY